MSEETNLKLLVLARTCSLVGRYTNREVKVCGFLNDEIRPWRENWQQGKSWKSGYGYENSKKPGWFANVRKKTLGEEESSAGLLLEIGGRAKKAGKPRGADRGPARRGGRAREA